MGRVLIIGGSGFLSGAMARRALSEGHEVWTITRGRRALPEGVHALTVDRRDRPAFASAIAGASVRWDLVVDCIGFDAADARQDVEVLTASRAGHLVFISTDSVIEPIDRPWSIDETYERFTTLAYGLGKREAEEVFLKAAARRDPNRARWTILRPGHIYGPGSLLGALPRHWRDPDLLQRIEAQQALALVGGGRFLHQPVFAPDLWHMAQSCARSPRSDGEIYFAPGPDTIETRDYYRFVAEALGTSLPPIEEVSVSRHLQEHPEDLPACCHRVTSTRKARAHELALPTTPVRDGIRTHVQFLRNHASSVEGPARPRTLAGANVLANATLLGAATILANATALVCATSLAFAAGCGTSGGGSPGASASSASGATVDNDAAGTSTESAGRASTA
ncbi:MAG TPA: NAD-dependent epimerase/dehydratase family protein, partial [Polyangiaceae bacterium]|nr:NAD-dependent epimerase/dehydratase family protein [Polyangiaceae bacterium]